ncbi:hypothetical protein EKK58_08495 [Candidatus Dependentiae bacterium]|nr:MAG: hypothetical protein EKK58_08495 [Candidatus Dependentiae bacterium]
MKLTKSQFLKDTLKHCGIPYIWGGESTKGADCSGLMEIVLSQWGLNPDGRQTAQRFYDFFSKPTYGVVIKDRSQVKEGDLIFYGKSTSKITHIAMALDNVDMIEAGGGGSAITTMQKALDANAKVRMAKIDRRNDIVAFVRINGLEIV